MSFDKYGLTLRHALENMVIIQSHFGFRVYLSTSFDDVSPLLHPSTQVVKPHYRDIISGRGPGALNGLDSVDLSPSTFHIVGMSSTAADVVVELVLRRAKAH